MSAEAFRDCSALKTVCVSPDYNFDSFCGRPVNSSSDTCISFMKVFNHCYKGTYNEGEIGTEKRKNATDWENKTSGCMMYQCNNESGSLSWSICNSSESTSLMCLDDKCIQKDSYADRKASVVIDFTDGVNVNEMNLTDLIETISRLCGLDPSEIEIGFEIDDYGYVMSVTVFVDDESTAKVIAEKINDLDKGEGCGYAILCKRKTVRVLTYRDISGSVHHILTPFLGLFVSVLFFSLI